MRIQTFGLAVALCAIPLTAQAPDARQQLVAYLNRIAFAQLQQRAQAIASIQSQAQAERRKSAVRAKMLELIGGLPENRGPVPVRQFGSIDGDGFRVEKIAYQSLPGLYVTADVYVPASGAGPFPAVILTPGHEPTAKLGQYNWSANLARAGILSLAIDPIGQGERLQHFDVELGESKVGQGTGEHGMAAFSALLIGDHVARYFINDGVRGIDYLSARKDVDPAHIGAFGCSGGGTATAYLAAMDPRIKVAATACYITSMEELLPATGNQEAEQSIPNFLADDFDFGDWVEMAAPIPYAIVSTEDDMFPFAGARQTFEEAKRIYGLYNAADRIEWIHGPGRHGNLGPIGGQIVSFLVRNLKPGAPEPAFGQFKLAHRDELLCTPTGQVSTSLGGETVESINRKRAQDLLAPKRAALAADIRAITGSLAEPGAAPAVTVVKSEARDGYRVDTIAMESEPGVTVAGLAGIPDGSAAKPALLYMDSAAKEQLAGRPDFEAMVKGGRIVLLLQPRGTPGPATGVQSSLLGPFNLIALRAMMVGKPIVGLRMDDAIRAVNWLVSRVDVDRSKIAVYGNGPLGVVALHAAALDSRMARVVIENSLADYALALNAPLTRNLPEIALDGVLRKYDLGGLMLVIAPRTVAVVNPVDAVGQPLREESARKELSYALSDRVRIYQRSPGEALPLQ
jgi:cephalosporin-C deacetylase-like acetyl esterase